MYAVHQSLNMSVSPYDKYVTLIAIRYKQPTSLCCMVRTNDAPVFMKVEGLILMTAAVISLVFTYVDSIRLTDESLKLGLDSKTILVIFTAIGVATIICVYGILVCSRICWALSIAGFIVMIIFNIPKFEMIYNLVPLIFNTLALITLFRPSVIRYVFRIQKKAPVES